MKIDDIPDYAKPYKKKGYDIRYRSGKYVLYKISSKRVEGYKYPKLIQEYIGIINEDGTLESKKEKINEKQEYLEYGLSNFIYTRFYRDLVRSMFAGAGDLANAYVYIAITSYITGSISDLAINSIYGTSKYKDDIAKVKSIASSGKRIVNLVKRIDNNMKTLFGDDVNDVEALLRLVVVRKDVYKINPYYPLELNELLNKHGVKLWERQNTL